MNVTTTRKVSQTDWARIDALSDDMIDTSDNPMLDDNFFANALIRLPTTPITLHLDRQLLAWFSQQEDSHKHMVQALQEYVERQQR